MANKSKKKKVYKSKNKKILLEIIKIEMEKVDKKNKLML